MKILTYKENNLLVAIFESVAKLNSNKNKYKANLVMSDSGLEVYVYMNTRSPDGYESIEVLDAHNSFWNDTVSLVMNKDGKMQTEVNLDKILNILKKYIDK